MAFNDLDINQMVGLFSPYVNNPEIKKTFLSIPEFAGLHRSVVAAYGGTLSVRPTEAVTDPEIVQISTRQKGVDNRHDHLARAIALFLEAHRERALGEDPPDEDAAAAFEAAYQAILQGSTAITMAPYRAETGHTERVQGLLAAPDSAPTKAVLKSIPVRKGETALDTTHLWIAAGTELGTLETKKAARTAALQTKPAAPARVVQQARSQWIKVANLLLQAAEVSDAPPDTLHAILHPLLDAAHRATPRSPRKGAGPGDGGGASGDAGGPGGDSGGAGPTPT